MRKISMLLLLGAASLLSACTTPPFDAQKEAAAWHGEYNQHNHTVIQNQ